MTAADLRMPVEQRPRPNVSAEILQAFGIAVIQPAAALFTTA
jgi:hypothetical protein